MNPAFACQSGTERQKGGVFAYIYALCVSSESAVEKAVRFEREYSPTM